MAVAIDWGTKLTWQAIVSSLPLSVSARSPEGIDSWIGHRSRYRCSYVFFAVGRVADKVHRRIAGTVLIKKNYLNPFLTVFFFFLNNHRNLNLAQQR